MENSLTTSPTTPRGALSPNLAAKLDELADRGRQDRILSELGINPAEARVGPHQVDGQIALFDTVDGTAFTSFEGESL